MINYDNAKGHMPGLCLGSSVNGGVVATALSSAYTHGSAGAAIAFMIWPTQGETLNKFQFYVTAVAGTPASITLNVEVRTITSLATNAVGSIITNGTAATSTTPAANQWIQATFSTPPTLVAGTPYAIIVYNGSASPTVNFATVADQGPVNISTAGPDQAYLYTYRGFRTTNGFSTNATINNRAQPFLAVFSSGRNEGSIYYDTANYTSNTEYRGYYLPAFGANMELYGIVSSMTENIAVFAAATAPTGSPLASRTLATGNNGAAFFQPILLDGNTDYRVVLKPAASSGNPGVFRCPDSARFSELLASKAFGAYSCQASGSSWVDATADLPRFRLFFRSADSAAGGSGGVRRADLNGGFNG